MTNTETIVLISILSVLSALIIFTFFTWLVTRTRIIDYASKGSRVYGVDAKHSLIIRKETPLVRDKQALHSRFGGSTEWENISFLFTWLKDSAGEEALHEAVRELVATRPNHYSFNFTSTLPSIKRLKKYNFKVVFDFYLSENDIYNLVVKWNIIIPERKKITYEAKYITRSELAGMLAPYTGFVAFNIKKNKDVSAKLLKIISSILHSHVLTFYSNGLLIIVFQSKDEKSINAHVKRFISDFNDRGMKLGAQQLFEGSAYVCVENGHKPDIQSMAIRALDYYVSDSIKTKRNFVLLKSKDYNYADFEEFTRSNLAFRNAIREREIEHIKKPIKRYDDKKKIAEILEPVIKGIPEPMLEKIARNFNSAQELTDAVSSQISSSKKSDHDFVDVTETWLTINAPSMYNKAPIYIVGLDDRVGASLITKVILEMKSKGFKFGLRINEYNEKAYILLKSTVPNFIIIDKSFISNGNIFESNTYINLLMMAEQAKQEEIKLIYENPPEGIDEVTASKIGLQYFF